MSTRTQVMDDKQQSALRARQQQLVIEVSTLKSRLHAAECELIRVDRQLGERRDQHPTTTQGNY